MFKFANLTEQGGFFVTTADAPLVGKLKTMVDVAINIAI